MENDPSHDPRDSSGLRPSRAIRERLLAADGSAAVVARPALPPMNRWARRALEIGERLIEERRGLSYRVTAFIGRGGMGEVYEVEQDGTGERFAAKCMQLAKVDDPRAVLRARMEAEVLERLRDPHVVPVFAMGVRDDGLIWMIMKLLRGRTLKQILKERGHLPMPWALTIARDVCRGLVAIHELAIHRDIKPDNIFIDLEGRVWVLDLGAARFSQHGLTTTGGFIIGTLAYMSPEQLINADKIDHRTDLFALGVTLYETLSGLHPFLERDETHETRTVGTAIIYKEPPRLREAAPQVPGYLDAITMTLLAKKREERYPDARSAELALNAALGRLEVDLGPIPPLSALSEALGPPPAPDAAAPSERGGAGAPGSTAALPPASGSRERETRAEEIPAEGPFGTTVMTARGRTERMSVTPADAAAVGPRGTRRMAPVPRLRDATTDRRPALELSPERDDEPRVIVQQAASPGRLRRDLDRRARDVLVLGVGIGLGLGLIALVALLVHAALPRPERLAAPAASPAPAAQPPAVSLTTPAAPMPSVVAAPPIPSTEPIVAATASASAPALPVSAAPAPAPAPAASAARPPPRPRSPKPKPTGLFEKELDL